jgi:hypothetical protein
MPSPFAPVDKIEDLYCTGEPEDLPVTQILGVTWADTTILSDATKPLVVVVSTAKAVAVLPGLLERRPLAAVIAYRLREEHLLRLLQMDVPVVIGLPTPGDLLRCVNTGTDLIDRAKELEFGARLSLREAMFETSHGTLVEAGA